MKVYIELSDSRNKALKKLMDGCQFTEDIKECNAAIFAPNKKWDEKTVKSLPDGITVFAGKGNELLFEKKNIEYVNFMDNQTFAIKNANLTAEGVLAFMFSEARKSLYQQKILIMGLGRCGRAQAILFGRLGLDVNAVAFRDEDFTASALYVKKCYFQDEYKRHLREYDIILNNNILKERLSDESIAQIRPDALVVEVATVNPCMDADKARHFRYVPAPGLPARFSPESAAELMRDVVAENLPDLFASKLVHFASVETQKEISQKKSVGFAITGSFCTHDAVIKEIEKLIKKGYNIVPILSPSVSSTDTRFGKAEDFKKKLEILTGNKAIETMSGVEPLGPKGIIDALVIAPCTGNTLSKLANAISDTPVTMAAKSLMRNFKPIIISVSTNDALGFNLANISKLIAAKNIYFVPFGQDDPKNKPKSLIADVGLIEETLTAAEKGEQLQPVLRSGK